MTVMYQATCPKVRLSEREPGPPGHEHYVEIYSGQHRAKHCIIEQSTASVAFRATSTLRFHQEPHYPSLVSTFSIRPPKPADHNPVGECLWGVSLGSSGSIRCKPGVPPGADFTAWEMIETSCSVKPRLIPPSCGTRHPG